MFAQTEELESPRPPDTDDIDLSPFQRRVLVHLHRAVMAAQGNLSAEYYDVEEEVRQIQILEHGFEGDYSDEFAGINPPMSRAQCELVWDILDMFRIINASVDALGTEEENGWSKLGINQRYGSFRGFDANHAVEHRLLSYTRFLVKNGRWEEQAHFMNSRERGNSHRQMIPTYRSMLSVFKPIWSQTVKSGTRWHLTEDNLRTVFMEVPGAGPDDDDD
ncbi:YfbU family protein [Arthrobacter sp. NPDC092385]|uniref:YfbU family protein n=1 Tax=Arthrobacter sp. NPDC092385 TaxID=3363943 RepID=UPI0018C50CC8